MNSTTICGLKDTLSCILKLFVSLCEEWEIHANSQNPELLCGALAEGRITSRSSLAATQPRIVGRYSFFTRVQASAAEDVKGWESPSIFWFFLCQGRGASVPAYWLLSVPNPPRCSSLMKPTSKHCHWAQGNGARSFAALVSLAPTMWAWVSGRSWPSASLCSFFFLFLLFFFLYFSSLSSVARERWVYASLHRAEGEKGQGKCLINPVLPY